jgi:predicted transposase YbfD/YdcC
MVDIFLDTLPSLAHPTLVDLPPLSQEDPMREPAPCHTICECFSPVDDPRIERNKKHLLLDIIAIAICAVVSGADDWVAVAEFGQNKIDWLRQFLALPHGIPSHDTFGKVFARICPNQFSQCFLDWVQQVFEVTDGQIIPIDGKTLRRSHDRSGGKAAIHMVSAWAAANQIVLGQVKTEEKSNEITAIPQLLRLLDIKGCIVTIDAMGCQTEIAAQIIDQQGDYVLALKGNQSSVHDAVIAFFQDPRLEQDPDFTLHHHQSTDGGHGRVEIRRYRCCSDIDWLDETGRWKDLQSICEVTSERHVGNEISQEIRYFIGSIKPDPKLWARAVRDHWGIENKLHWRLDVAFREDDSRVRKGHGPENFAVLRHLALNLITQETSTKASTKTKRYRAALSDEYRLKVLNG